MPKARASAAEPVEKAAEPTQPELNEDGLVAGAPVDFATIQRILAGNRYDKASTQTDDAPAADQLSPADAEASE
jgi:hypothetical protein